MTEFNTFVFQMILQHANLERKIAQQQTVIGGLLHKNQELNILVGYLSDQIQEFNHIDNGEDLPHADEE